LTAGPFPYDDPQAWQCVIGSMWIDMRTLVVDVKGLKTKNKSDKAGGMGRDFGSIRHKGRELATFTIRSSPRGSRRAGSSSTASFGWAYGLADRGEKDMAVVVYHPILDTRGTSHQMYIDDHRWAGVRPRSRAR
jgi:hypothetical protein